MRGLAMEEADTEAASSAMEVAGLASGDMEMGKKKELVAKRTFHACSLSSKVRN
jgi:hypothetical protein